MDLNCGSTSASRTVAVLCQPVRMRRGIPLRHATFQSEQMSGINLHAAWWAPHLSTSMLATARLSPCICVSRLSSAGQLALVSPRSVCAAVGDCGTPRRVSKR